MKDPSDLGLNPSEKWEIDVGACPQGHLGGDQGQGNQEQGALAS